MTIKKLLAVLLSVALILSLAAPALAATAEDWAAETPAGEPAGATTEGAEDPPAQEAEEPAQLMTATNLALNAPATASEQQSDTYSAAKAVDGNASHGSDETFWETRWGGGADNPTVQNTQLPAWLQVDLGRDGAVVENIVLKFRGDQYSNDYTISTSSTGADGSWTAIYTLSGRTGAANYVEDTISASSLSNPTLKRYVRVTFTTMNVINRAISVLEFEVNGELPDAPAPSTERNLALYHPVLASGDQGDASTPSKAVDGDTETKWRTPNLKDWQENNIGNSKDNDAQTPQWLRIDLGASDSQITQIKLTYKNKVWPMKYIIQTSDNPADTDTPDPEDASWTTLVSVDRPSANALVTNGNGQDIANTAANTDTITLTSVPALDDQVTVGRYVRLWLYKTNAQAPGGSNVDLAEIEIIGTNSAPVLSAPVAPSAGIGSLNVTLQNGQYVPVSVPAGNTFAIRGSTLKNVVSADGTVGGYNIGARNVPLLVRLTSDSDPNTYAEKNVTVTVPDGKSNYTEAAAWFPAVASPNPKPKVIPTLQEWYGYEGAMTLDETSRIILDDAGEVGLQKAAKELQSDLAEITGLTVSIVSSGEPTGKDIVIHSLATDSYDLLEEGYILRVSADGAHIYAPTYTGCVYGTVSLAQMLWLAEDHLSIPMGITRDYPAYQIRGMKLDIGRAPTRYQYLLDYARVLRWYKMSEYDLHINDTENVNTLGAANASQAANLIGFHRLESSTFPSLKLMPGVKQAGVNANLVDADYYNSANGYGGNPVYTKQQWKDLTQLSQDYGMHLLTEIDMPGHALAYNQYVDRAFDSENPDETILSELTAAGITGPIRSTSNADYRATELLELVGPNAENALNFAKALWDEYTRDGTITGNVVHIGADEYWIHNAEYNNAFAVFANELRQVIQNNLGEDTKIRMWGASRSSFSTATTALDMTPQELAEHFELECWDNNSYENPVQRSKEGYKLVNCEQSAMYSCPGRHQRDVPNTEYLFNSWDPTMFGNSRLLYGDPNLLGAKGVMWGEQTQEGLTERDIHQRILRAASAVSEKTWLGTPAAEAAHPDFSQFELTASRLAEGPGTEIAMNIPSKTSLVLSYDFTNVAYVDEKTVVYDTSGNGYDGTIIAGVANENDPWLSFFSNTKLTTPLKAISYPYTVSFDLKLGVGNTAAASSLFSGYYGRIQPVGKNGHFTATECSFVRDFGYTLPTTDGKTFQHIDIVGTFQGTRLYVDGRCVSFLSQTGDNMQDGVRNGAISSYFSSVPFPLEKIGVGFRGALANLKVYNKALTADEIAAVQDGSAITKVNVAQNAWAGGSSFRAGDGFDGAANAYQRTSVAFKAVDGEEEEMYSFWQGDHGDSALTVDLGTARTVSEIDVVFRSDGVGADFKLQTSADGVTWADAKTVSGNSAAAYTAEITPVSARYVRYQANSSTANVVCKVAELRVYEQVDKTVLQLAAAQAEAYVKANGIAFSTEDQDEAAILNAWVFAQAVADSPIATQAEVDEALEGLRDAGILRVGLGELSVEGDEVTVPITNLSGESVGGTVVLASYNGGAFENVQYHTMDASADLSRSWTFTVKDATLRFKAFFLTNLTDCKPLSPVTEYPAGQ